MTQEQIEERLTERRGALEQVGGQLNQIQEEQGRLSARARQLQGAIAELEDMLKPAEDGDK